MTEKQKTLTLELDERKITITVLRATTRTGVKRSLMIYAAMDANEKSKKDGDPIDEVQYVLSYRTLPDLIAGTDSVKGMDFPITVDQLMDLPEQFVEEWINAIYELNPHWNPANIVTDEDKLKKTQSS